MPRIRGGRVVFWRAAFSFLKKALIYTRGLEFYGGGESVAATHMRKLARSTAFSSCVSLFALGLGLSAPLQGQTYLYWYNSVDAGADVQVEPLDESEFYDEENPTTSSTLSGGYQPSPNTYSMGYSSRVGSGVSASFSGSVNWDNPAFAYNEGFLQVSQGTDDQVRFVSTGGSGTITATFELVYGLSAGLSFPIGFGDAEVDVSSSVQIRAKNGGNGGPVLWDFRAYRDLQTYFGDGSPVDLETTNGESRFFTGTFSENQLVTFQLNVSSSIVATSADAEAGVMAYLVLRDITDGFALQSASGVDYAAAVPEPSSAAMLAGLAGLGIVALRRRGRRMARG